MSNLQEVLEFIKNSEKSELKSIYNAYSVRMSEIRHDEKESFRIGDIVGINHKTISKDDTFRIIKIMYFDHPKKPFENFKDIGLKVSLFSSCILLLSFFLYPSILNNIMSKISIF